MSMMPAFSPGPCSTSLLRGRQLLQVKARALVGAVLAPHHAEDAELGVGGLAPQQRHDLPIFALRQLMEGDQIGSDRAHSRGAGDGPREGFQNHQSVGGSHQRLGGAFRMRHHAHDIALFVQNAGDVAQGAVGIIEIAEHHAIFGFQLIERALVGNITAFSMRDGQMQNLAFCRRRR